MPESETRILHVLTGCTAVGKTEAALLWAEQNDAEIISCDSLLFYRGMDIGTAKPSRMELGRVSHHLIDIQDPGEQMDIGRFVSLARQSVLEIARRGRRVLVTGGSGFYLKSFFAPVVDDVEVSLEIREEVRNLNLADALAHLRQLNPAGLGKLDTANPRRVNRALERCLASGRTLEQLAASFAAKPAPFADWNVKLTRLEREQADLSDRIERRVQSMLEQGLVEEVTRLKATGFESNPSASGAIGYREVLSMLNGQLDISRLQPEICANTRALVKKQRTWFRTQLPPHRVSHPDKVAVNDLFLD